MVEVVTTRRGHPAVWEEGGAGRNTGDAVIVCGPGGEPLRPIAVRSGGHLSCSRHALFGLQPGTVAVEVRRQRDDAEVTLWQWDGEALQPFAAYAEGEWLVDEDGSNRYAAAVLAALCKSRCYHCRGSHYMADRGGAS